MISPLIIIFITTPKRTTTRKYLAYREALREQVQQHKHILIAPIMLIIFAIPRLIISVASECMESMNVSDGLFCCVCVAIQIMQESFSQVNGRLSTTHGETIASLVQLTTRRTVFSHRTRVSSAH